MKPCIIHVSSIKVPHGQIPEDLEFHLCTSKGPTGSWIDAWVTCNIYSSCAPRIYSHNKSYVHQCTARLCCTFHARHKQMNKQTNRYRYIYTYMHITLLLKLDYNRCQYIVMDDYRGGHPSRKSSDRRSNLCTKLVQGDALLGRMLWAVGETESLGRNSP